MATVARPAPESRAAAVEGRRALRDSLIVGLGGQLERLLGTLTTLALRWGLEPASLGVYTGLRLYLDNTNRSSLGVGLGAVQEVPILRASGREAEAKHLANVAHTTNTLTCLLYSAGLVALAWWWAPTRAADPSGAEWTWGLVATAGLALLRRYESFLTAVLRAYQEFGLTTRADILESLVSAVAVGAGLWLAGFWGLLAAVGVILGARVIYLHARHPLRFGWAWDGPEAARLMMVGLPILANTAAFGAVTGLDRVLILGLVPDGSRALGLYTIALIGTGWSLDLAGRFALVIYTYFQTTLGRTRDPLEVATMALRATEAQAPLLAAGGAAAYVFAPDFLGVLMPRYAGGLPALRPLLPGAVLLGMAWPARQMLIAIGRPYRLCLATLAGLAVLAEAGAIGASARGLVGLAGGVSIGYGAVFLLTSAAAFAGTIGGRAWTRHLGRIGLVLAWFGAGAWASSSLGGDRAGWPEFLARGLLLAGWGLPALGYWARRDGWPRARRRAGVAG